MKHLFILSLAFLLALPSHAQKGSIKGLITDPKGSPIPNLTVFIPFTSYHTTTNQEGVYHLKKLSIGDYELVFRHVAYETQSHQIKIEDNKILALDINMKDAVIELATIVKKADPGHWDFGWEKFKTFVLGDPLGRFCVVENPKDLYFYYDGEKLKGFTTQPIRVFNKYLGYNLTYFLDYFWFEETLNASEKAKPQITYAFAGSAFYTEVENPNMLTKVRWKRNREREFRGTLRHFLMVVHEQKLDEEGFDIRQSWSDKSDLQQSEGLSPSVAHVRFLQMRKVYSWDQERKQSTFKYFFPDQEFPFFNYCEKLNQIPPATKLLLSDDVLVFYYYNDYDPFEKARIAHLRLIPHNEEIEPSLQFDYLGNYTVSNGVLAWDYLDSSTSLAIALPGDYIPEF